MQRFTADSSFKPVVRLAAALAFASMAAGCKPVTFHGTAYEPPETAPSVVLDNAAGGKFDLADQHGSVVLLFFGYTHCPDVCPTTLSDWKRVKRELGHNASRVKFVFVSVDPARDDPATLHAYVSRFDADFIGATADSTTLAQIEKSFHVESSREDSSSATGYVVTHPSQTFMVDKAGRLRLLYSFGMKTSDVVSDIRGLLSGA
ncbi:MAG: SCO family protein [Gemmatimonadaceae bacterium]